MNRLRVWSLIAAALAIAVVICALRPEQRMAELRHIRSTPPGHKFCVTNCSSSSVLFTLRAIEERDTQKTGFDRALN